MSNPALSDEMLVALKAVQQPIGQARGLSNAAYTNAQLFEFERDHVMANTWAAIGFSNELPQGAYVKPVDFMGLPLALFKNDDGKIQVFHNVCSHRGMLLVQKEGAVNGMISCPYHSWTYDLQGQLRATPHIGGMNVHHVDGFECAGHGLKKVRCHVWMDIVFVNLSGDAIPFSKFIEPLESRWKAFTQHIGELSVPDDYGSLTLKLECNWKLIVENFCESYHLPWVHPSLNKISPLDQHYNVMIGDNMSGQGSHSYDYSEVAGAALPVFDDWPQDQAKTGEYIALYPNVLLGVQLDHAFAIILHPVSPGKTIESLQLYFLGDGASSDRYIDNRQSIMQAWEIVFGEDIFAVEGMQSGRQSPGYQGGVFSPVQDEATHHFHGWVANQYSSLERNV